VDALKSNPKSIAQEVILLIADLYNYEAEFKDKKLTYEEIAKFKKPRIIKAFFSLKRSAHLYLTCYFCYI
jgi:hypothetical protein